MWQFRHASNCFLFYFQFSAKRHKHRGNSFFYKKMKQWHVQSNQCCWSGSGLKTVLHLKIHAIFIFSSRCSSFLATHSCRSSFLFNLIHKHIIKLLSFDSIVGFPSINARSQTHKRRERERKIRNAIQTYAHLFNYRKSSLLLSFVAIMYICCCYSKTAKQ